LKWRNDINDVSGEDDINAAFMTWDAQKYPVIVVRSMSQKRCMIIVGLHDGAKLTSDEGNLASKSLHEPRAARI